MYQVSFYGDMKVERRRLPSLGQVYSIIRSRLKRRFPDCQIRSRLLSSGVGRGVRQSLEIDHPGGLREYLEVECRKV